MVGLWKDPCQKGGHSHADADKVGCHAKHGNDDTEIGREIYRSFSISPPSNPCLHIHIATAATRADAMVWAPARSSCGSSSLSSHLSISADRLGMHMYGHTGRVSVRLHIRAHNMDIWSRQDWHSHFSGWTEETSACPSRLVNKAASRRRCGVTTLPPCRKLRRALHPAEISRFCKAGDQAASASPSSSTRVQGATNEASSKLRGPGNPLPDWTSRRGRRPS